MSAAQTTDPMWLALKEWPELATQFSFQEILLFIELCCLLRPQIEIVKLIETDTPPVMIPLAIHEFLQTAISRTSERDISKKCIEYAWNALKKTVWQLPRRINGLDCSETHMKLLLMHGPVLKIGCLLFSPPIRHCDNPDCDRNPLSGRYRMGTVVGLEKETEIEVVAFTLKWGPLPAKALSLYCRGCKQTYHHDFFIHDDATKRMYYTIGDKHPLFIQSSKHVFFEWSLCEQFANMVTFVWASASNLARVYNLSHTGSESLRDRILWLATFKMTGDHVYDGFFLHALLLHHQANKTPLELPNRVDNQADRLRPALEARNDLFQGPGRPSSGHVCEVCSTYKKIDAESDDTSSSNLRLIRAMVTDGVTMGHPCCGVHECKEPLASNRHRYCPLHKGLERICSVGGCADNASSGFKTCDAHRELERNYYETGASFGCLMARAKRNGLIQLTDSLPTEVIPSRVDSHNRLKPYRSIPNQNSLTGILDDSGSAGNDSIVMPGGDESDSGEHVEDEGRSQNSSAPLRNPIISSPPLDDCDKKSPAGNRPRRTQFGRAHSHNEQLGLTTCGTIIGRQTFYGSEGTRNVVEFWKTLFPTTAHMPYFMFFDNNCTIMRHLLAKDCPQDDRRLLSMKLPVDVFHFRSKHKESDETCGNHCNPVLFKDLYREDGTWVFNSSIAEQTNVWFGGFLALTREMRVDRYNFLLDEVILRHNNAVHQDLVKKGKRIWNLAFHELK